MLELNEWLLSASVRHPELAGIAEIATIRKQLPLTQEFKEQWLDKLLIYPLQQLELWLVHFQWLSPLVRELQQFHRSLPIYSLKQLAVTGKHLLQWCNKPAGAWVKEQLHGLFIAVASGKLPNSIEPLKAYILAKNEGEGSNE